MYPGLPRFVTTQNKISGDIKKNVQVAWVMVTQYKSSGQKGILIWMWSMVHVVEDNITYTITAIL